MKRALPLLLVVVALAAVGLGFIALSSQPTWTASPEAAAEFDAYMDARARVYLSEAAEHLERALELDPDFVMAKLEMAFDDAGGEHDSEKRQQLLDEIRAADLDRLTELERLLVGFTLARADGNNETAESLLDRYLEKHPKSFYPLYIKATMVWNAGDLGRAEVLLRRVIELNPNWVLAHNLLGYVGMELGQFAQAEEHFRTYLFVAPDQANPHDSLGELLTLVGRFDEAAGSFETALAVHGDFWASYNHLMAVHLYQYDWEGAQSVADRVLAQEGHPEWMDVAHPCRLAVSRASWDRDWELVLETVDAECTTERSLIGVRSQIHRAACHLGDFDLAVQKEEELAERLGELSEAQRKEASFGLAAAEHLAGVRLAISGDLEGAVDRFRAADGFARFRGEGEGIFKLANRMCLGAVLRKLGHLGEAEKVIESVRSVNPTLTDLWLTEVDAALGLD